MALANLLRPIYRVLQRMTNSTIATIISYQYRNHKAKNQSTHEYVGNVLVVKNPVYAKLARLCVESFLYHNPNCQVIVHVDPSTKSAVLKAFRKVAKNGNVEIKDLINPDGTWQEIKLRIILEMLSPAKFFMDADLRWNGPMPQLNGATFFVNEFEFKNKFPYSTLLDFSGWTSTHDFTMKNTSFLYWGDFEPKSEDHLFINDSMNIIHKFCDEIRVPPEERDSVIRISEQIALSALVDVRNLEVKFLKEVDGYRDGTFVESSYFGATGSAF